MKNLFFIYGTDGYRLQQRLHELMLADEFNRTAVDASDNWSTSEFAAQAQAVPLFGVERQIIVKNAFAGIGADEVDKVIGVLEKVPETTSIIFVESGKPDARTKFFKTLSKTAKVETFEPLRGFAWTKFVDETTRAGGLRLSQTARDALVIDLEGDSAQLIQVVNQLKLWAGPPASALPEAKLQAMRAGDREINTDDVSYFVPRRPQGDSFKLLGALSDRRASEVVHYLNDLWRQDEAPMRVLGAITYQYRQLVWAKAYLDDGVPAKDLASKMRVPPFVASRIAQIAARVSWTWVKAVYSQIGQIDESIKNGKLEQKAGIELLVYNLVKLHGDTSRVEPVLAIV